MKWPHSFRASRPALTEREAMAADEASLREFLYAGDEAIACDEHPSQVAMNEILAAEAGCGTPEPTAGALGSRAAMSAHPVRSTASLARRRQADRESSRSIAITLLGIHCAAVVWGMAQASPQNHRARGKRMFDLQHWHI